MRKENPFLKRAIAIRNDLEQQSGTVSELIDVGILNALIYVGEQLSMINANIAVISNHLRSQR